MAVEITDLINQVADGTLDVPEQEVENHESSSWPILPREQAQICVRLPNALVAELDRRAESQGMKRAALIRRVLSDYISS